MLSILYKVNAFLDFWILQVLRLLGEEGFTVVNKSFGDNNHCGVFCGKFIIAMVPPGWFNIGAHNKAKGI